MNLLGIQVVASTVVPRELAGGMAVLTGEPSFYTYKTRQFSKVAIITKTAFYE